MTPATASLMKTISAVPSTSELPAETPASAKRRSVQVFAAVANSMKSTKFHVGKSPISGIFLRGFEISDGFRFLEAVLFELYLKYEDEGGRIDEWG